MKANISEMFVFTLIIGKISEGNLNYINTLKNSVQTGDLDNLSAATKMDVQMNINVCKVMDGKSKSITQKTISLIFVDTENNVIKLIVLIIIIITIKDNFLLNGLKYFLKLGSLIFLQTTICLT